MKDIHVIMVDENDRAIGSMEKISAHEEGVLHRAFSVFLFNENNELLLQKRSNAKYHSAGLWSNTCCSHPLPGEPMLLAVERALEREMGIKCDVEKVGEFIYKEELANGLIEHEFDHLFVGKYSGEPAPNPAEVYAWKYMSIKNILNDLTLNKLQYTVWFPFALEKVIKKMSFK